MSSLIKLSCLILLCFQAFLSSGQSSIIRAGHVVDTKNGQLQADQRIEIENGRILSIRDWTGPVTDDIIDLSDSYVLPGLIDAHTHMALVVDAKKDGGSYYVTSLLNPTPYRAVQGVANAKDMLESGFTAIRDIGNSGNYADIAIKQGIEEGLVPGPYMLTAGRIIAPFGGQFFMQPEKPGLGNPEYFYADGEQEIRKAVRENLHYGADFIKIVVDDQRYIYSVEEIAAAVDEAERAGTYVAAHCWTEQGARNAVEAGVRSIEHGPTMPDDLLRKAKEKGIFLVGTEFTVEGLGATFAGDDLSAFEKEHEMFVDRLKRAYSIGVEIVYGSDAVFLDPKMGRGHVSLDVLNSWREAGVSNADQLKALTYTAARLMKIEKDRGSIEKGKIADLIAVPENPLEDTKVLYKVHFVMQGGTIIKHN